MQYFTEHDVEEKAYGFFQYDMKPHGMFRVEGSAFRV